MFTYSGKEVQGFSPVNKMPMALQDHHPILATVSNPLHPLSSSSLEKQLCTIATTVGSPLVSKSSEDTIKNMASTLKIPCINTLLLPASSNKDNYVEMESGLCFGGKLTIQLPVVSTNMRHLIGHYTTTPICPSYSETQHLPTCIPPIQKNTPLPSAMIPSPLLSPKPSSAPIPALQITPQTEVHSGDQDKCPPNLPTSSEETTSNEGLTFTDVAIELGKHAILYN